MYVLYILIYTLQLSIRTDPLSNIEMDNGIVYHEVVDPRVERYVDGGGNRSEEIQDCEVWVIFNLCATDRNPRTSGVVIHPILWRSSWCLGELLRQAHDEAKIKLSRHRQEDPYVRDDCVFDIGDEVTGWRGHFSGNKKPSEMYVEISMNCRSVKVVCPGTFYGMELDA